MADVIRELVEKTLDKEKRGDSEVKIAKYDSGGANYTSALYKVVVTTSGEEQRLFAKVASFGQAMRESFSTDWIFHTELYVYNELVQVYEDIQRRHAVPPQHKFVFPKFFCCSREKGSETVVTEDLDARGFSTYDRFNVMDWEYASTSVQALARFHALSFAYEKEKPEEFRRVAVEMESKLTSERENMKQIWGPLVENSIIVLEEAKRDRVRKILYDDQIMSNYAKPVEKIVLVHGDYRLSNLLFKKQEDALEVIPVDYQLVHSGCVASDLMYFISLGSDRQFRTKYFHKLVDYYYEQLAISLERLSLDIVDLYPRETFDMELKKILPEILVHGMMILPAVTVDTDSKPDLTNSFENFKIRPNEMFKKRFNEIVDDCIEWGVI